MLEYKEDEDMQCLSQDKSRLQPNLEILSEFKTATLCAANSKTLMTSNEESLNTKVIDLFELYKIESKFALFGFQMRNLWSKKVQNKEG